jgi:hypothetical protein
MPAATSEAEIDFLFTFFGCLYPPTRDCWNPYPECGVLRFVPVASVMGAILDPKLRIYFTHSCKTFQDRGSCSLEWPRGPFTILFGVWCRNTQDKTSICQLEQKSLILNCAVGVLEDLSLSFTVLVHIGHASCVSQS